MTQASADDELTEMLVAFAAGDLPAALVAARRGAARTADPVARAAETYLGGVIARGARPVYEQAEAFGAFIRGGGNQRLYRATSEALRAIYRELPPGARVLDVGVGDGLALVPAIEGVIAELRAELTVLEPAEELLSRTTRALDGLGVRYEAFPGTIEELIRTHGERRFELIEATFSLHGLQPDGRRDVLAWMRGAAGRLVIAEFDVPRFGGALDPAHIAYVIDRYRRGLAEYADDGDLVAQGFLMPVMFGYFTTGRARVTYEQPMAAWIEDLRAAGFTEIGARVIDPYWWAPAFVLDARGRGGGGDGGGDPRA
ncbi:MAG TPA: class I SAM-dependent methyltransferase [Kofleriaceae bacterium]|nr:class I SAM-dependent methyltransferase [Kofleriaceae bacterium]